MYSCCILICLLFCVLDILFLHSIVLEVVLYPVFLKLICIVSVSNYGGILSVPAALLSFSLLSIVHISLYFGDDTS